MSFEKELETARKTALLAGKRILEFYGRDIDTYEKNDENFKSPLTIADTEANELIVNALKSEFPEDGIISEESADDDTRLQKERVWIIDPLDGTKEFIKRNGEFTVNIALAREGRPALGVIYVPVKGDLYYAAEGRGASHEKDGKIERIRASGTYALKEMILVKSRSHASAKLVNMIEQVGFAGVKTCGSSVKGCLVASGDADIYYRFGRTMEWDICAMHCIIDEAGGKLTDLDGKTIIYNKTKPEIKGFVASNGKIHETLVKLGEKGD